MEPSHTGTPLPPYSATGCYPRWRAVPPESSGYSTWGCIHKWGADLVSHCSLPSPGGLAWRFLVSPVHYVLAPGAKFGYARSLCHAVTAGAGELRGQRGADGFFNQYGVLGLGL